MSAELPLVTSSENAGDYCQCERHTKRLEYLCDTHGYHVCADCAVFDHRDCTIVSIKTTSEHEKLSKYISPVLIMASHHIRDVNPKLGRLLQSRDVVSLTLDSHYQKLRDAIDAAESEQYAQLDFLFGIEETRLLAWKDECQQLIDKAKSRLESVKKGTTTSVNKVTKEVETIKTQLEDTLQGNDTNVSFTFVGDTDFDQKVDTCSLLPGKIVVKHEPMVSCVQATGLSGKDWTGIDPESPAILSESESESFVEIPLDGTTSNVSTVENQVNVISEESARAERRGSTLDQVTQEIKGAESSRPLFSIFVYPWTINVVTARGVLSDVEEFD
ncbi:E3 ubiquitin/ISG15 ligase TRIM25-like [Pecten maximus]|uniref:E3 ubiquitin/ISG15 ligase TRIM25-like n=1 Tax=Pecten maximus TaxID=6579 RepID=UPI00145819CF|nr:E3 ubiquitin/ISG15 ligase TRIM25-like [Pecten maximus]